MDAVNDVTFLRDPVTRKHKGFAYVELRQEASVPRLLALGGSVPDFQKFPILCQQAEAEKLAESALARLARERDHHAGEWAGGGGGGHPRDAARRAADWECPACKVRGLGLGPGPTGGAPACKVRGGSAGALGPRGSRGQSAPRLQGGSARRSDFLLSRALSRARRSPPVRRSLGGRRK